MGAGQGFNRSTVLPRAPEELMRELLGAVSGAAGYTVTTGGGNSLILTRKYTPTWAVIGGVAGLLFLLLGALLFLVKETETLTITLRPVPGGTELTAAGLATPDLIARITAVVIASAAGPAHAAPPAASNGGLEQRLATLARLREAGTISEVEFAEQRGRILAQV